MTHRIEWPDFTIWYEERGCEWVMVAWAIHPNLMHPYKGAALRAIARGVKQPHRQGDGQQ